MFPRARAVLPLLASALAVGVAGCGFTPLYATPGVPTAMNAVAIDVPPHSRTGYLMRQQLDEELALDLSAEPRYRLALTLDEHRYPRGVRVNNVANRYEIQLNVGYVLTDAATGRVVLKGVAPVEVTYDSADAPYAGVAASEDGEERAAGQAAVLIRLQLARFLASTPATLSRPSDTRSAP